MLPQSFYNHPTLKVAQDLLGCFLVRKIGNKTIKAKIVETEAYAGPNDLASHASKGKTERNGVMFGKPGIIYVYFTYGMHYMLNIVTEEKNYPAAVLIRAVEPISTIPNQKSQIKNHKLFSGPARLTKALKIDKSFNCLPIYTKKYGLWIEVPPAPREAGLRRTSRQKIIKAKRIGVDYAGEYKNKLWRFYIKGNKFVSKK